MNWDYLGPVLALVLGWFLGEGSHLLRLRAERRKAIRVALAELLEVRHRVIGHGFLLEQLQNRLNLSAKILIELRSKLPMPLRIDSGVSDRLNAAIAEISRFDAFLAYELRGKDTIGLVEEALNAKELHEDTLADYLVQTQKDLRQHFLTVLDEVIVDCAWRSSVLDWYRAVIRIRVRPRVSEEIKQTTDNYLDSLKENLTVNAEATRADRV